VLSRYSLRVHKEVNQHIRHENDSGNQQAAVFVESWCDMYGYCECTMQQCHVLTVVKHLGIQQLKTLRIDGKHECCHDKYMTSPVLLTTHLSIVAACSCG
jgi:hypothetical protein